MSGFIFTYNFDNTVITGIASGSGQALIPDQVTAIDNNVFYQNIDITQLTCVSTSSSLQTIGISCFEGCTSLTSVTLSSTIQNIQIGSSGFKDCTSLTLVTLGSSFQTIGADCFNSCTNLTSVTCVNTNPTMFTPPSIGNNAFYFCPALQQVTMPSNIDSIGNSAFISSGLKNVIFGSSLQTIGANCFEECSDLTNVSFGPPGVVSLSIGIDAFKNCSSLQQIVIPDNTISIGVGAFLPSGLRNVTLKTDDIGLFPAIYPSPTITSVTISASSTSICAECFDTAGFPTITITPLITSIGNKAFYTCALQQITIPDTIIFFGEEVFAICTSLTSVTLPNNFGFINNSTFASCSSLTQITIPESVTAIGGSAFASCSSLTQITIPDGVTSVQPGSFALSAIKQVTLKTDIIGLNNSSFFPAFPVENITSVTITETSNSICAYCFAFCEILPFVTIPNTVTYIGEFAFQNCLALSNIILPTNLNYIGENCFENTNSLSRDIIIPQNVNEINDSTFENSSLTGVTIEEPNLALFYDNIDFDTSEYLKAAARTKAISFGKRAFANARKIKKVIYVQPLGFKNDDQIFNLKLDNPVNTIIDDEAFLGCSELTEFTIPTSTTYIGLSAFQDCISLSEITIPESVSTINDLAFFECTSLNTLIIDGTTTFNTPATSFTNAPVKSLTYNSVFYDDVEVDIGIVKANLTSITLIGNITTIQPGDFDNLPNLQDFSIPASVVTIGQNVFPQSTDLYSLTIQGGPSIADNAFTGNPITNLAFNTNLLSSLSSIHIVPENLSAITVLSGSTTILSNTFFGLNITSITLPSTLTSIGSSCFQNTTDLAIDFVIPQNVNIINTSTFQNSGVTSVTIQNLGNVSFGTSSFADAASLKIVRILPALSLNNDEPIINLELDSSAGTFIANDAFINNSSLTQFTIPTTTTYIGDSAFENCLSLLNITIPAAVTTVDIDAFKNCSALSSVILQCSGTDTFMNENSFQDTTSINSSSETIINLQAKGYTVGELTFAGFDMTVICFKEDSKILCLVDGQEKEVLVQDLRKGVLVKTLLSGYVPVCMIGTSKIYNFGNNDRIKDRLYLCSKEKYPELNEDLIITGGHSILVDEFVGTQLEQTKKMCGGRFFFTENKLRLLACLDDRATPYDKEGEHNIYHFALENEEYNSNYGVYANGLLVETCDKCHLIEFSHMKFL